LPSALESGKQAGFDGARCKREGPRWQGQPLAEQVHNVTAHSGEVTCVEQGYIGERPKHEAAHRLHLHMVKRPEAKKGFVLLLRRWVIERRVAWVARFRRLARDDERLPEVLAGVHC
jgi:hypothetical protein